MKKIILLAFVIMIFSCAKEIKTETVVLSKYPDGTTLTEGIYKWRGNEKVKIKEISYFPSGVIEYEGELNYKQQKHGLWVYWYEDGTKWLEENYENNILHGKFTEWYLSGEKSYEGEYSDGIPAGTWTFWDADGNKSKELVYKNGKAVE